MKIEKIEVNYSRIRSLLKSDSVMETLLKQGESMGEVDGKYRGFDRAHVVIKKGGSDHDHREDSS